MNRDEQHSRKIRDLFDIFGYSRNIVLIIVYDDAQWETFYILNKIHHMLPVIRSCFSSLSARLHSLLYNFYIKVSLLLWMLINVVHGYKDTAIILTKWSTDRFRLLYIVDQSNVWKFDFFFLLVSKLLCFVHHKALLNAVTCNNKTASN